MLGVIMVNKVSSSSSPVLSDDLPMFGEFCELSLNAFLQLEYRAVCHCVVCSPKSTKLNSIFLFLCISFQIQPVGLFDELVNVDFVNVIKRHFRATMT